MHDEERSGRLITPTFLGVMAAAFAFFLYVGVLVPIVPTFVENDMRGGELGIGLAIASFAGAAILARPLIGRLIDRYGRRAVMVGGGLLAAASGLLYGYVDSLPSLLVLRAFSGVGEAALFVGAATLVADLSPHHRRAEGASYFSVAVYAGIGIGPVIGEAVLDGHGLRTAFAIAAAFAAVASAVSLSLPARVAPHPVRRDVDEPARHPDGTFVHRAALGPGLVLASGMAAFAVFPAFLPDYSRSLGLSGSGGLFALYSAVCVVLRFVGAKLPDRLGARTSVTVAFTLLGLALTLLAAVPQAWALWASAALIGTGMAFMYPSLMALTLTRASELEHPRAVSSFTMFFEVGTAVGGLALGALADSFGKRTGFATAVALCPVGLWMLWTRVLPTEPADVRVTPQPSFVPVAGDCPAGRPT